MKMENNGEGEGKEKSEGILLSSATADESRLEIINDAQERSLVHSNQ